MASLNAELLLERVDYALEERRRAKIGCRCGTALKPLVKRERPDRRQPGPSNSVLRLSTHVFVLRPDGGAVSSSSLPARNLRPTYTANIIEPNRNAITTGARGIANRSSVSRSSTNNTMSTTRNAAITHAKLPAAARKRDCTDMETYPLVVKPAHSSRLLRCRLMLGRMGAFVRLGACVSRKTRPRPPPAGAFDSRSYQTGAAEG